MGAVADAIAQMIGQQNVADQNYPAKIIGNMKRVASVLIAHMDQSHPEVAQHMVKAYTALMAAEKAAQQAAKSNGPNAGGPIQFSGAQVTPQIGGGLR